MFLNFETAEIVNPLEGVEKIVVVNNSGNPASEAFKKKLNKLEQEETTTIKHAGEYHVAYNRSGLKLDGNFKPFDRTNGMFQFKGKKQGDFIPLFKMYYRIEGAIMFCW